jgi:hypothetical protein
VHSADPAAETAPEQSADPAAETSVDQTAGPAVHSADPAAEQLVDPAAETALEPSAKAADETSAVQSTDTAAKLVRAVSSTRWRNCGRAVSFRASESVPEQPAGPAADCCLAVSPNQVLQLLVSSQLSHLPCLLLTLHTLTWCKTIFRTAVSQHMNRFLGLAMDQLLDLLLIRQLNQLRNTQN